MRRTPFAHRRLPRPAVHDPQKDSQTRSRSGSKFGRRPNRRISQNPSTRGSVTSDLVTLDIACIRVGGSSSHPGGISRRSTGSTLNRQRKRSRKSSGTDTKVHSRSCYDPISMVATTQNLRPLTECSVSLRFAIWLPLLLLLPGCTTRGDYEHARRIDTISAYETFLEKHPGSQYVPSVTDRLSILREQARARQKKEEEGKRRKSEEAEEAEQEMRRHQAEAREDNPRRLELLLSRYKLGKTSEQEFQRDFPHSGELLDGKLSFIAGRLHEGKSIYFVGVQKELSPMTPQIHGLFRDLVSQSQSSDVSRGVVIYPPRFYDGELAVDVVCWLHFSDRLLSGLDCDRDTLNDRETLKRIFDGPD